MKIGDISFAAPAASQAAPQRPAAASGDTIVSRFQQVAAAMAERTAVRDQHGQLTYVELDRLANRVANFIVALNLGPEARVGLLFGRNRLFVAAALGVLKAGAVYVPLDPVLPLEHRVRLANLAGARLIIAPAAQARDLRVMQWRCPAARHILVMDADDIDALIESPGAMMNTELWDHLAGDAADDILAGGWKSAFSGLPLSAQAMAAFGQNARRKTAGLIPPGGRVLEIGCASGFTMRHVAPLAGAYLAVDIARRNLDRVWAHALAHGLGQVAVRQMAANDLDVFEPGSFDLIIMNSVVENFPGFGYLRSVLDKALAVLAPGGALYLGSIWDMDRRAAYLADLADFARQNAGQGYKTRLDFTEDLFVPQAFFRQWAAERGGDMGLEFSAIDAPGFEPAAYEYDLVIRPGHGGGADPAAPFRPRHDRRALDAQPETPPAVRIGPDHAAYVIFTSGTTGRPKGVLVEHHSVVNLADSVARTIFAPLGPQNGLAVSCIASFIFDGSVKQIFATLLAGHTLHLPNEEAKRDPARLHQFIEDHRLDLCDPTPSLFAMLVDHWRESGQRTSARTFLLGGEALQPELPRTFYDLEGHGEARLINAYGPTECCVAACQHVMTAASWREILPPPIGAPLAGVEIMVCDAAGRPLPPGVPGEIRIGGAGVARGYLDDPEQTAQRFVTDERGRRWYRSGDMGRWLPGGLLAFLGREDRQVKIRGNRIELAEVEAALCAHPLVRRAVVLALDARGDGNRLLAAYLVTRPGFDLAGLKADLDAALPSYMTPSWLVVVDDIPLTASGKVDESRLPPPAQANAANQRPARPLDGQIQLRLAAVWSRVLGAPVADADADFFVMGGHSVLAVRLLAEVEREFDLRLPLSELFARSTLAGLARRIEEGQRQDGWRPVVVVNEKAQGAPLVFFHPVGGHVLCYQGLIARLGLDAPLYLLQAQGLEEGQSLPPTVEDMVTGYLDALTPLLPDGPLNLAGWSFGGLLAYEAACRLQRAGARVGAVMLLDSVAVPDPVREMLRMDEEDYLAAMFHEMGLVTADELRGLNQTQRLDLLLERGRGTEYLPEGMDRASMRRLLALMQNNALAAVRYRPPRLDGPLLLVRPRVITKAAPGVPGDDLSGWGPLAGGGVTLRWMDGAHGQMLQEPHVDQLAAHVRAFLAETAD